MPILLTTPWDPGNFDAGNTYPRAKILGFHYREMLPLVDPEGSGSEFELDIVVDFGDIVEGNWVPGSAPGKTKSIHITDGEEAELTDLMSTVSQADETAYEVVKRAIYAYPVANIAELAGTVE